jgi:hypothetical protein
MQQGDRRLDALTYSLGWVALIASVWLLAGWVAYLARITGKLRFIPDAWWPSPEVHLIFIGAAKLMVMGLIMAWLALLLYRGRLRRS